MKQTIKQIIFDDGWYVLTDMGKVYLLCWSLPQNRGTFEREPSWVLQNWPELPELNGETK